MSMQELPVRIKLEPRHGLPNPEKLSVCGRNIFENCLFNVNPRLFNARDNPDLVDHMPNSFSSFVSACKIKFFIVVLKITHLLPMSTFQFTLNLLGEKLQLRDVLSRKF